MLVFPKKLRPLHPPTSTGPRPGPGSTCPHHGLRLGARLHILHSDKLTVREEKIDALIKMGGGCGGFSVKPFWPSLLAKVLANVYIRSLNSSAGAEGATPPPLEKKVGASLRGVS